MVIQVGVVAPEVVGLVLEVNPAQPILVVEQEADLILAQAVPASLF